MTESQNPLQKHFRRPAIYFKLPSQGKFWPDGSVDLTATGELPVLPMTSKDEITIRTPDALLNGTGVVDVIKSCIPCIKDPWKMPSIDVDATLIAIRIASYSNMMDIDTKCPHCNEDNTYSVDLNNVLSNISAPNYDETLTIGELTFKFRPQQYFEINKANLVNFEEQKLLNTVRDDTLEEAERSERFAAHLLRLVDLSNQLFVDSTESITTVDGIKVVEPAFINEFYKNSDRKIITEVKKKLESMGEVSKIKPVTVNCNDCSKPFSVNITFDYSHFFA